MDPNSVVHFLSLVGTGAIVGLAVGLTGVGGGSLMTPALVSGFGIPAPIAVGTDLAFAAITKSAGIAAHRKTGAVQWRTVTLMMASSVPACLLALWVMSFTPVSTASGTMKTTLGIALLGTAIAVLLKGKLKLPAIKNMHLRYLLTMIFGALIGWMVAWSSVGAGAIGCTVLALLYPELEAQEIAATDIAYAVPLTAVGAIGHGLSGNVDALLLGSLLIGSVPAIWLGVRLGQALNQKFARGLLATLLTAAAAKSLSF
jgi:uncharacterized protein